MGVNLSNARELTSQEKDELIESLLNKNDKLAARYKSNNKLLNEAKEICETYYTEKPQERLKNLIFENTKLKASLLLYINQDTKNNRLIKEINELKQFKKNCILLFQKMNLEEISKIGIVLNQSKTINKFKAFWA